MRTPIVRANGRDQQRLYSLREFCEAERVTTATVLRGWAKHGQAPRLTRVNGRTYVSVAAWREWHARLDADRQRTGNIRLRAPLPTTPRGPMKWISSVEGL